MSRILGWRWTKRTAAAVGVALLAALAAWAIDTVLHGPRALEPGDKAVADRVLGGLRAWDAATCSERRAAAVWVGSSTPGFTFERLARFGFDEHKHEIAVFTHEQTGLEFSLILGGTFQMGSPADEVDREDDETQHTVTIGGPFLLCRTETTQTAWTRVMATKPSRTAGADHPVETVSWDDAQEFCGKTGLRLPSEAQWEYACRGGTTTRFWSGDGADDLARVGWYDENTTPLFASVYPYLRWTGLRPPVRSHASVAAKSANPFGLHDMHGNVWEWCDDWYGSYPSGSVTDPTGPSSASTNRVLRGGSWCRPARFARSAYRFRFVPGLRYFDFGFRPAQSVATD